MSTLSERLAIPSEMFTQSDVFAAFEELAEQYGFHRSPELPSRSAIAETTSISVPHFEDLGVLIVKPRTIEDTLIRIPNLTDQLLGENVNPTQETLFNIRLVALAETVIVSPPGFVRSLRKADDSEVFRLVEEEINGKKTSLQKYFFLEFANEYQRWMSYRAAESKAKKSGSPVGTEPAS